MYVKTMLQEWYNFHMKLAGMYENDKMLNLAQERTAQARAIRLVADELKIKLKLIE